MDPLGLFRDTAADPCDPWPVVRLAPGLYECAGGGPDVWWRVDLRGRVPACSCRQPGWRGGICWHIRETRRQAGILEERAPVRAA